MFARHERVFAHVQQSLDDLGAPLDEVTFCVLDLETTGGSAANCYITEIGAVKVRGGEALGTFQTLVNPGCAIPPTITVLTGITESMVIRAPRIEGVLGSFMDFIGDAVIVGHNVRFDMGFIQAALERDERPLLANVTVDTVALARRLVRDEVPNCRLGTLAERFRLPHRPSHRALDDALATADLLHVLLERAGSLGVRGLDDLRSLPTMAGHAQASKLRLTEGLPRCPGVYLFRDRAGRILYVGKATNLRSRVRSYFSTDDRRKIGALLRETERIDHKRCADELEAAVLEMRLIHHLKPHYNRAGKRWERSVYLALDLHGRYPRLRIVREPKDARDLHIGPIASRATAKLAIEALHSVVPLRQCTSLPGRSRRTGPCLASQLGLAHCPCSGEVSPEDYRPVVDRAVEALTTRPELVTAELEEHMMALAQAERFEEAASVRDRLQAFTDVIARQRRFDQLRRMERVVVVRSDGLRAEFERGRLTRIRPPLPVPRSRTPTLDDPRSDPHAGTHLVEAIPEDPGPPELGSLPANLADELGITGRWLDRGAANLRLIGVSGEWSSVWSPVPA